jgi:hypothetical protein
MLNLLTQEARKRSLAVPVPYMFTTHHILGLEYHEGKAYRARVPSAFASLTGEWTGYYGYRYHLRGLAGPSTCLSCVGSWYRGVEDPPMRFTLSTSEPVHYSGPVLSGIPEDSDVHRLLGEGVDGVGPFAISGWAWSTGEVMFTKRYVGQHSWIYKGQILPWGVVGAWNEGPFWIWRTASGTEAPQ